MEHCGHCDTALSELPHWQHVIVQLVDEHLQDLKLETGIWLLPTVKNQLCAQFGVLLRAYGKETPSITEG